MTQKELQDKVIVELILRRKMAENGKPNMQSHIDARLADKKEQVKQRHH
jgi:hypothetical protein